MRLRPSPLPDVIHVTREAARIAELEHEVARLTRYNEELRGALAALLAPNAPLPTDERTKEDLFRAARRL